MNFDDRYSYDPNEDLIGTGGFSRIYKAFDSLREEHVALKFFHADVNEKYGIVAEAKRLLKLYHPNVVRFYDLETLERQNVHMQMEQVLVGVMEYIDKGDLAKAKELNLTDQQKFEITLGFVRSLEYIHSVGLIHRDIKPHNILLKSNESGGYEPKLADFGISKTTEDGATASSQLLGTVEYMAPEQFNPEKYGKVSQPTDLWSMAVVVYELYTGERLFGSRSGGQSTEQVISKILIDDIPSGFDGLPDRIRTLIEMCLVREVDKREQSATNILNMLEGHGTGSIPKEVIKPVVEADPDATQVISKDHIPDADTPSTAPAEPDDPDATKVITGDVIRAATGDVTKQAEEAAASPPPPTEPPAPDPQPVAAEPAAPVAQPATEAPAKKGKGKMIAIVVIAAVVLGGGGWFVSTMGGDDPKDPEEEEVVEATISADDVLTTGMSSFLALNYTQALKEFENARDLGSSEANLMLGIMHMEGFGTDKDIYEAKDLFSQGLNDTVPKDIQSINRYGLALLSADYPELYDAELLGADQSDFSDIRYRAFIAIEDKADTNLYWMTHLGEMLYDNGNGTPEEFGEAYDLFERAAAKGYAPAQTMIGIMAMYNEIPDDRMTDDMRSMSSDDLAKAWLQKGSEQGHPEAQDNLGWMLWSAEESPEGIALMTKAANQGYAMSMLGLGDCYYRGGETLEKDYGKAVSWFAKAGDAFNLDGAYSAGKLYYDGK